MPAPGPAEVRIKVKAIGINRAESMWRNDKYIERSVTYPAGLGYEAPGIVDAVGRDVTGAFVLAQHLRPEHKASLSAMPVVD